MLQQFPGSQVTRLDIKKDSKNKTGKALIERTLLLLLLLMDFCPNNNGYV